jgi:hypothetical protein
MRSRNFSQFFGVARRVWFSEVDQHEMRLLLRQYFENVFHRDVVIAVSASITANPQSALPRYFPFHSGLALSSSVSSLSFEVITHASVLSIHDLI